jgi:hypothetical protein
MDLPSDRDKMGNNRLMALSGGILTIERSRVDGLRFPALTAPETTIDK